MKYPDPYEDFAFEQIIYGVNAPFVGIGLYTLDGKFSWPDLEGTTKKEYDRWVEHLKSNGYEIPEDYKDAHV